MKENNLKKTKKAFTLIEVLVVIALIGFLAAITIIAINPAKNFQDARNTQRRSDVTQILNAVTQYTSQSGNLISDFGTIPNCSTPDFLIIGTTVDPDYIDLSTLLVPTYLVGIPRDPSGGTAADTGYTICLAASNRVTVSAPDAESTTITVSR